MMQSHLGADLESVSGQWPYIAFSSHTFDGLFGGKSLNTEWFIVVYCGVIGNVRVGQCLKQQSVSTKSISDALS